MTKKVFDAVQSCTQHHFSINYCDKIKGIRLEIDYCLSDNDKFWESFWYNLVHFYTCTQEEADTYRDDIISEVKKIARAKRESMGPSSGPFAFLFM